jgi:hypothetical protein
MIRRATCFLVLLIAICAPLARGQAAYEGEPINYNTAPVDDAISKFQARLDAGKAKLTYDNRHGYLESVLKNLGIPASSQSLVFSKTSLQRDAISPDRPRALYFDDEVYVGWVQNGEVLEIAATDPKLGPIFYTLDQQQTDKPRFVRQTDKCTQCHGTSMTGDIPGLIMRSVHTDPAGQPVLTAGTAITTQSSPLEERWGGWYATGTHGDRRHMGNVMTKDRDDDGPLDLDTGANVTSLGDYFDTDRYLSPGSDFIALMVLGHQAEAHNLFTRLSYQAQWAMRDSKAINEALGNGGAELSDSAKRRIQSSGENLVRYLLYCDEELLTDRVAGTSSFVTDFSNRGPRDRQGRSLRDFDLRRRMFRYPLSYLVYSPSFDALPAPAKEYVYKRMWEVLSGQDKDPVFKHISTEQRQAILEILRDTKPGLPDYFGK